MHVGIAVVADCVARVPVDGGEVVVEVAVPPASRAVVLDPLSQPVPLHCARRVFRMHDQSRQPLLAFVFLGALIGGQPGAAGRVAVFDMDGPPGWCPVGDLLSAVGAVPVERREVARARGQPVKGVLGRAEQQSRPGLGVFPAGRADHPGDVLIAADAAGGGDDVPPAAARPGGGGQPDQFLIRYRGSRAEVSGEFGQRLVHSRELKERQLDGAGLRPGL